MNRHTHISTGMGLAILALLAGSTHAATFRIEIDYMENANHSHRPSQLVVDAVVQMFACQGHTLIIDVDDAVPHYNVLQRNSTFCYNSLFDYGGTPDSFLAIKDAYFDHEHSDGWHYCIFSHNYKDDECNVTSSSGLAERPGWNFTVSLGSFSNSIGTPFEQAATLAHEFGHNLGLTHCGSMNCSGSTSDSDWVGPYTPNLPSIMSYRYQLAGVRNNMLFNGLVPPEALFKDLDYSHGTLCGLNENSLNEVFGTCMRSVDWNCSVTLQSSVAQDINGDSDGWCGSSGNRTNLTDFNEWSTISDPSLMPVAPPQEVSCITAEQWQRVKDGMRGGAGSPTLVVESCISGRNVFIGAGLIPIGSCTFPYTSVQVAHNAAPNNSVFFFRSGVYDEPGTVTLNKPGLYMSNVGLTEVR